MIQKNNSVSSAGTKDDSSTNADLNPSAPITPNPMLAAVSLRDYLASKAMVAEIQIWNSEMSNKHRSEIVKDWEKRFGNVRIDKCIALASYEMADAMLSVRNGS